MNINDILLKEDEVIDDLEIKNYRIIQKKKGFKFSIDAVLLSNFVKNKKNGKVLDLGTGTGIIPLLLNAKGDFKKIIGVEIQEEIANMAMRSLKLNNVQEKVEIKNVDLRKLNEIMEKDSFDIVTSNPPYMQKDKLLSCNESVKISRNEIFCNIEDIFKIASFLLKPNGKFYLVHRPSRLGDILYYSRIYRLEAKIMRFVHPSIYKSPNLVLISFTKLGKAEVKIMPPLYVYNEKNEYTNTIKEIYSKEKLDFV